MMQLCQASCLISVVLRWQLGRERVSFSVVGIGSSLVVAADEEEGGNASISTFPRLAWQSWPTAEAWRGARWETMWPETRKHSSWGNEACLFFCPFSPRGRCHTMLYQNPLQVPALSEKMWKRERRRAFRCTNWKTVCLCVAGRFGSFIYVRLKTKLCICVLISFVCNSRL